MNRIDFKRIRRVLDEQYFPILGFPDHDISITPTGYFRYWPGAIWRSSLPVVQRTKLGPHFEIKDEGVYSLADLLASAFFDIQDGYYADWSKDAGKVFNLSTLVVVDSSGRPVSFNEAGRKINLLLAEARLELEQDKIAKAEREAKRAAQQAEREAKRAAQQAEAARRLVAKKVECTTRFERCRHEQNRLERENKRVRATLEMEAKWLMQRWTETPSDRAYRQQQELKIVRQRLTNEIDALLVYLKKCIAEDPSVDIVSILPDEIGRNLSIIRRDYPELNCYTTLEIAELLLRTKSRNSTVCSLFKELTRKRNIASIAKYYHANSSLDYELSCHRPNYYAKECISRLLQECDIKEGAARYGLESHMHLLVDPIADRELKDYGIQASINLTRGFETYDDSDETL